MFFRSYTPTGKVVLRRCAIHFVGRCPTLNILKPYGQIKLRMKNLLPRFGLPVGL